MSVPGNDPVLAVEGLRVALPSWSDRPLAVDGVSLAMERNEILCVVGESGSGKSVMAKSILGLLPAPHVRVTEGAIHFDGRDLLQADEDHLRSVRGGRISMIFQEPMVALNPLMKVGKQIDEVFQVHTELSTQERRARVVELFADVHLPDPERCLVELHRVIKPAGSLTIQVPFIYPLHDAPLDFHRWTRYGLRRAAQRCGFTIESESAIGHPLETAALNANIAMSKSVINWLQGRNPLALLGLLLPPGILLINSDDQNIVTLKGVRRHYQVCRSRHTGIDATCKVKF